MKIVDFKTVLSCPGATTLIEDLKELLKGKEILKLLVKSKF